MIRGTNRSCRSTGVAECGAPWFGRRLWLESRTNDRSAQTEVAEVAGVTGVQELQNVELSGVKEDSWLKSGTNDRS
jgi:hypothetical protein